MGDILNTEFLSRILAPLRHTPQDPVHHPEGDVLTHTMQVCNLACRETDDVELRLAALLHDVGKQIEGHGHEKHSVDLVRDVVSEKTLWLIENHMRFWYWIDGRMKKLSKVRGMSESPWIGDLACLARWDRAGLKAGVRVELDVDKILMKLDPEYARYLPLDY